MTIGGLIMAAVLLVFSFLKNIAWLRTFVLGGVVIWLVGYAILLFVNSIFSEEKILALNEPKEYCGFYLDCHLHTVVTDVRTAKQIGDKTAEGEFYIVKVKVFSNAKNPSIAFHLIEPKAEITGESGRIYSRLKEVENQLPTGQVELNQDIKGAETIEKEIVFDITESSKDLKLLITEGYGIDKAIEAVLIGDEDSILHKHSYFKLEAENQFVSNRKSEEIHTAK